MIAFRLDANSSVATGHMYRCISIAKQCRKKGYECIFLLAEDECTEILRNAGFEYCVLNLKWDDWNYGIDIVKKCLQEKGAKCLVVDSYRVTEQFFSSLHKEVPIFYLDDLCEKKYDLDAVLHYSEWEDEQIIANLYRNTDVRVYSGMKYMPLRENFAVSPFETEKKYQFLITTGGSDTYHITRKLLVAMLQDTRLKEEKICAVLGKMNLDSEEIRMLCNEHKNVTVLQNISNMDEVMRQSVFAVTAGGTSVYELMASGVPFVCFGFSDDQKYFGLRLENHGNASWAGDARDDADAVVQKIMQEFKSMLQLSAEGIQKVIQGNRRLIDGCGAERVCNIIIELFKEKDKNV